MTHYKPTQEEEHEEFIVTLLSALIYREKYDDDFINKCIDYTKKFLDGNHTVYDIPNDVYRTAMFLSSELNKDIFSDSDYPTIYKNILKELKK